MARNSARRLLCLLLCLVFLIPPVFSADSPTEADVYNSILALKSVYPEGSPWTNDDYRGWHGASRDYPYYGGWGCVGFAYMVSDAAFGNLPAKCIDGPLDFNQVRPGDILRLNGNKHSVVVLTVGPSFVTVVEGNYEGTVHWGRALSRSQVENSYYMLTRYPYDPPAKPDPKTGFTDISSRAWYYPALLWAVKRGITTGTTPTTFSPEDTCDRAQALTFLWRTMGKPAPTTGRNPFTDVPPGKYFTRPVFWAYGAKITSGTTATTFSPMQTVTRQEVITMIWRAMGSPNPKSTASPFPDVRNPRSFSYKAILWGYEQRIVAGTDGGLFRPEDPCTRAQIVTFLYRAFG